MKRSLVVLILSGAAWAQESAADRVSVAFSDPARPGTLRASVHYGSVTVKGYDGKEVIVEARVRARGQERREPGQDQQAPGLRRIAVSATNLSVEEENNVMSVSAGPPGRAVDLVIQVPRRTSLKVRAHNDGFVLVEQVQGEVEASNHNGSVTLTRIAGWAVANTHNGEVKVSFDRVEPGKPMSFSSFNGAVDVSLPADTKANLKIKSERGEVFSDFEIQLQADRAKPVAEDNRGKGGKYRVRVDKAVYGAINGGGAELQFANYNGSIYIRKGGGR